MARKRISKQAIKMQIYKPKGDYIFYKKDLYTYDLYFYNTIDFNCVNTIIGCNIEKLFNKYSGMYFYRISTLIS